MSNHVTQLTIEEMVESLTGYEELAVAKHFGDEVGKLLDSKPTMGLRSLIFAHVARDEGMRPELAKKTAMDLTVKAVSTYFRDDTDDEIDPVDLETESGKDAALSI